MKADYKRKATLVHVVFQLTIFVIFMKAKVTAEMVEGCVESQLTLSCNETKVINISSVVLGDSSGCSGTNCCPKHDSCTAKPNDRHVYEVHKRCSGRRWCTVDVIKEAIPCIYAYGREDNDFERIVYDCIDNERTTTDAIKTTRGTDFHANKTEETSKFTHEGPTDKVVYTSVTKTSISEDAVTSDKPGMLKGTEPMPIIIAIVCLLVLITVIVVVIVLIKRKRKKSQLNANSNPAKLSVVSHDVDDTAYEEIATNGDRTYEKFVPSGSEDVDKHTYTAIATSGDRTYEKFVPSGTEDVDKHTYAGLVTKIEAPTYLQLI